MQILTLSRVFFLKVLRDLWVVSWLLMPTWTLQFASSY